MGKKAWCFVNASPMRSTCVHYYFDITYNRYAESGLYNEDITYKLFMIFIEIDDF